MGYIYKTKALLIFLIGIAILAASCRNPSGNVPSDSTGSGKTATTDLSELIDSAKTLYNELEESKKDGKDIEKGKYWVESKWKLQVAIETAEEVLNNPNATAAEIQEALQLLNEAYNKANTDKKPGKYGKTDVTELLALISQAQGLSGVLEVSPDGKTIYADTYWVSNDVKQALDSAISAAIEEAAKEFSTQDAVDEALKALQDAYHTADTRKRKGDFSANKTALEAQIKAAEEKKIGVKTSANGSDIPKYEKWVTPGELASLLAEITRAEALVNDPYARQNAVDAETTALQNVIAAFVPKEGEKNADISDLRNLIEEARALLTELKGFWESSDGMESNGTKLYGDMHWISKDQKETLANAISAAQKAADNDLITPAEVEEAAEALYAVFYDASVASVEQLGKFEANKAALQEQIALANDKMTIGAVISDEGMDILTSGYWVTHDVMYAFDDAFRKAETLLDDPNARQEAVDEATQKLDAAIAAFTPKPGLLTPGLAKIFTFEGPGDETFTLPGAQNLSWAENTILNVTAPETFDRYQWYVDGEIKEGETTASISLNARDFFPGVHKLTLKVVTEDGVPYTKTLTFTVD